jgi:hypothetical protein
MTTEEAATRYIALCERNPEDIATLESLVEPSEKVSRFTADLHARYPSPSDLSDEEFDTGPWSCDHDLSEGHIIMAIRWSRADEIGPIVHELACKHGLILFDPQTNRVYRPQT